MKTVAFYLPQYHAIEENDQWWGKGFTDWINVRKSRPRFRGHYQPHVPLNEDYYDLSNKLSIQKQASLAKEYGIDAFCIYHYWFNGKMLLEKPLDIILNNQEIGIDFCICWANENWTRRWDGKSREILINQNYQEYDAAAHAEWMISSLSDKRYLEIKGARPIVIYRPDEIPNLSAVIETWKRKFSEVGIYNVEIYGITNNNDENLLSAGIDKIINFVPGRFFPERSSRKEFTLAVLKSVIRRELKIKIIRVKPKIEFAKIFNYQKIVRNSLQIRDRVPCIMPTWDNSARRSTDITIIQNSSVSLFSSWLHDSFDIAKEEGHGCVFINAWNEWGEGCHLEPDMMFGYEWLEAVRKEKDAI